MPVSKSHQAAQSRAAGRTGKKEAPLPSGKRLDVDKKFRAVEIERSGSLELLRSAALRLKESGRPQKILQVPAKDMAEAKTAMRSVRITGTVKNMSGTKVTYVGAKRVKPTLKPRESAKKRA